MAARKKRAPRARKVTAKATASASTETVAPVVKAGYRTPSRSIGRAERLAGPQGNT
jgi:hypothetical protein